MRIFVCAKCFNSGGTLQNQGTHKQPLYSHAPGKCGAINYLVRNEIYSRLYPHLFWLPLLNIGVDFNREEIFLK
jgi:hypothetical protein